MPGRRVSGVLMGLVALVLAIWIGPKYPPSGQSWDLEDGSFLVLEGTPSGAAGYVCAKVAVSGEPPGCEAARDARERRFNVWRAGLVAAAGGVVVGGLVAIWPRRRRLLVEVDERPAPVADSAGWLPDDGAWSRFSAQQEQ